MAEHIRFVESGDPAGKIETVGHGKPSFAIVRQVIREAAPRLTSDKMHFTVYSSDREL